MSITKLFTDRSSCKKLEVFIHVIPAPKCNTVDSPYYHRKYLRTTSIYLQYLHFGEGINHPGYVLNLVQFVVKYCTINNS